MRKINDKQRQEIRKLNQCTNDLKKQRNNEELKVYELEQYDKRQILIFEVILQVQNKNMTEIILSLARKLNVNLTANNISMHIGSLSNPQDRTVKLVKLDVILE